MNLEISGWACTQASREVSCPRCHSKPFEHCKTPKGRRANLHGERLRAYIDKIGRDEFAYDFEFSRDAPPGWKEDDWQGDGWDCKHYCPKCAKKK